MKINVHQKRVLSRYYLDLGYKPCWSCMTVKEISEFNKDAQKSHGLCGKCKKCHTKYTRMYEANNQDKVKRWKEDNIVKIVSSRHKYYISNVKERNGERYSKEAEARKEYARNRYYSHRKNSEAIHAVSLAVKRGDLIRPDNCTICGCECKIEAHHEDYDRPLDVVWACSSCHKRIHAGTICLIFGKKNHRPTAVSAT